MEREREREEESCACANADMSTAGAIKDICMQRGRYSGGQSQQGRVSQGFRAPAWGCESILPTSYIVNIINIA
jgi:hypothetical protein